MFYKSQQDSTYSDLNIVPVWQSINNGNWKLVGEVIRKLAADTLTDLQVWAGGIDILRLSKKKIYLARDALNRAIVQVPKVLFKCVYDRKRNRGLVFLTVNDPHVAEVNADYLICEKDPRCELMYQQFSKTKDGYTYCCSLASFQIHAEQLGIFNYPNSTSPSTFL